MRICRTLQKSGTNGGDREDIVGTLKNLYGHK